MGFSFKLLLGLTLSNYLDCNGQQFTIFSKIIDFNVKFIVYIQDPISSSAADIIKFWSKQNIYVCFFRGRPVEKKSFENYQDTRTAITALIVDGKILEELDFIFTTISDRSSLKIFTESRRKTYPFSVDDAVILYPKSERRPKRDFGGIILRVATLQQNCDAIHREPATEKAACFQQEILIAMGRRMNFTPNFIDCPDKEHPFVLPNGSYSGLFKMLLDGSADVCCSSFVVSESRLASFDFVWPTFVLRTMMFVKRFDAERSWKSYLKPLDEEVWWMLFFWTFLSGFSFYLFACSREMKNVDLAETLLTSFRVFCNQAVTDVPKCDSWKILYACTLFLAAFIFPAYSGSVVSFLTVRTPSFPFDSLHQFFENGKYQIMAKNGSFIASYFKHEYLPLNQPTKSHLMADIFRMPNNDQIGLELICTKKASYVGLKEDIDNVKVHQCEIIEIPTPIGLQYHGLGLPKGSLHTRSLTMQLSYFRSAGLLHRMKLSIGGISDLGKENAKNRTPLSLSEIFPGFVLLVVGSGISLLVLICEIRIRKRNINYNTRK